MKRYESFAAPSMAWMFIVQYGLGNTDPVDGRSQYDFRNPALSECGALPVISVVGMLPLFFGCLGSVMQYGQPMEQPWLHHKHG